MTAVIKEKSVYISRLKRLAKHLNVAIFYADHSEFSGRGRFVCDGIGQEPFDDWKLTESQATYLGECWPGAP
jgi:hypothetical protein